MSLNQRRTRQVFDAFQAIAATGRNPIQSGEINAYLREQNLPMGSWEVRGELSNLEARGLVVHNAEENLWRLVDDAEFETSAQSNVG